MSVLKYTLVVRHPDTNAATALIAGTAVPEWAKGLVQPDDLLAEAQANEPEKKAPAKKASASKTGK